MVRVEELDNLDDDDQPQQPKQKPKVRQRHNGNNTTKAVVAEMSENGQIQEIAAEGAEEPAETELTFDQQVDQAREQYQATPMEKFMALMKSLILRALVVYFVMSFVRSGSGTTKSAPSASSADGSKPPPSLASSNAFINGTQFDMYVYISELSKDIGDFTNERLIWKQEGMIYGDWHAGPNGDGTLTHSLQLPLSKRVQNNGSLYIHTYLVPLGFSPDPLNKERYSKSLTVHSSKMINKFKKKKYGKTRNLLTGETAASLEEQEKAKKMTSEIISHWHPNLTIGLVTDWTQWTVGAVPAPLNEYIQFIPNELKYQPVLFYNDYWNLLKEYSPINSSTSVVPLTLTFQPLSLFKWQIYAAQSMRNQWSANFLAGQEDEDEDQDALKEAMIETNPYLLGLTFAISILHSIFEFLAFKNDIQFWNNRKSLEGLSVRSVFFNVFQSLIVLLYVLDNETNFVIRVSVFIGLVIEIWKINKVVDFKVDHDNKILGLIPRISFADKGSYVESSTRMYDRLAFRYLSWLLFPLLGGYAIYSIVYQEHKGAYSWVLSMAYGFLLTFGFIMMTPQLFINYKLKSVAHLPWRMLTYKFLNTFIDDIFAFVIKMPTMYRIGCLRDDVIFFIYLYQRYVYRIDPTRVNEFGFSAEMLDEKTAIAGGGGEEKPTNTNGVLPVEDASEKTDEDKNGEEDKIKTKAPQQPSKKSKTKVKKDQ